MLSVGLSEIVMVIVVSVLALKPEQMVDAVKMCRSLWVDWCRCRASFETKQLQLEKEDALAKRTALAASVSDVSDLLDKPHE